jgi:tetratricopeptide (TPR) repeat protein
MPGTAAGEKGEASREQPNPSVVVIAMDLARVRRNANCVRADSRTRSWLVELPPGNSMTAAATTRRSPGKALKFAYLSLAGTAMLAAMQVRAAEAAHINEPGHEHSTGEVEFPVSCSAPAKVQFNHALALLHHMTYPQARKGFERVAELDEHCAMAYWGVAMTLFQPLWPTRPRPADLQRGWDSIGKAKALQPPTEREREFIAAAEAFFTDPATSDYWLRIRRWEQASRHVHERWPEDTEAALFYALAHLATTPPDRITRAHADEAARILLRLYGRQPDHPGVMHYLIHANDVPGRERELLDVTRKYEQIAPDNPHALHMPTHIYVRLGDWTSVIRGNLRAADAALEHPAGERGDLVSDEFAHAVEYLVYAYLQQGADAAAAAQLQRLQATARLEPTFKTAFHLASTQARYVLERRAWQEAEHIATHSSARQWDRFTWPQATAHFARGLGAAHLGKTQDAQDTVQRLARLEAATEASGEALFTRNVRMLRLELSAWVAHTRGSSARGESLLRDAAALEDATPKHAVTPGPALPAYELLGDLLMEQGKTADALDAYKRSLARYPGRFNSLLGAARAAHALRDIATSHAFFEELLRVAGSGQRLKAVQEARDHLGAR